MPGVFSKRIMVLLTVLILAVFSCISTTANHPAERLMDPSTDNHPIGEQPGRSDPVTYDEDSLLNRSLPMGVVGYSDDYVETLTVGDADNDGENEILIGNDSTVTLWRWVDGALYPDGCFTVPFEVDAENWGLKAALVADADGKPGNETLLVMAASDVEGDPYNAQGRFFVYTTDENGEFEKIADVDTGTVGTRPLRMETEGAYAVENCLAVADLTGDGGPEIVLGTAFYTRQTRIYRLEGDPPELKLIWSDEEDTADSNCILPYAIGDETVLMVGMGHGIPPQTGYQIRTFKWVDRFGTFVRGPVTNADGAVWSMTASDLDADGVEEVIATVHESTGLEGSYSHLLVLRPTPELVLQPLLEISFDKPPNDVMAIDFLPDRGPELIVTFNSRLPQAYSFPAGLRDPVLYNLEPYGREGRYNITPFIVSYASVEKCDMVSGGDRMSLLRFGPDLALDTGPWELLSAIVLEEGEGYHTVRIENVGALASAGAELVVSADDKWTHRVPIPPLSHGRTFEVDVPIPPGPFEGNITISINPFSPEEEVFDWNDRWEGYLTVPPIGTAGGDDGPPPVPLLPLLVTAALVIGSGAVGRHIFNTRARRRIMPLPVLLRYWKRNARKRKALVLAFLQEHREEGVTVRDIVEEFDVAINTAKGYLSDLERAGRVKGFKTKSGWIYVPVGKDPPPGSAQGLGLTARCLYTIVLGCPGLMVGELVALATGEGQRPRTMSERMVIHNLRLLTDRGLIVRRDRGDGRVGINPAVMILVKEFLERTRPGEVVPWDLLRRYLADKGQVLTQREFDLFAPYIGARLVRREGRWEIHVEVAEEG